MQATASRGVNDNVASVLMRAEVIQHMDPRSLARCLTTCTALRAPHECDAWKVLADELASSPLPDAASRHAFLRSYCQPRLLAEGLSNLAVSSPLVIDQLDDYVIHLRINMGAVALWEGSVPLEGGGPPFFLAPYSFDLELRQLPLLRTASLVELLAWDASRDYEEEDPETLKLITFTLVAVRKADHKMIPLGCLKYDGACGSVGSRHGLYLYGAPAPFYKVGEVYFKVWSCLELWHCTQGGGYLDVLHVGIADKDDLEGPKGLKLRQLFTYLAGCPPLHRDQLMAAILEGDGDDDDD